MLGPKVSSQNPQLKRQHDLYTTDQTVIKKQKYTTTSNKYNQSQFPNSSQNVTSESLKISHLLNPQPELPQRQYTYLKQSQKLPHPKPVDNVQEKHLSNLVNLACAVINNIWPAHSNTQKTQLCSLKAFVTETFKSSKLNTIVLELALIYLLKAKSAISSKRKAEIEQKLSLSLISNSTPASPSDSSKTISNPTTPSPETSLSHDRNHSDSPNTAVNSSNPNTSNLSSPAASPVTPVSNYPTEVKYPLNQGLTTSEINLTLQHYHQLKTELFKNQLKNEHPASVNSDPLKESLARAIVKIIQLRNSKQPNSLLANSTLPSGPNSITKNDIIMPNNPIKSIISDKSSTNLTNLLNEVTNPEQNIAVPSQKKSVDMTICGRRMFVAALISASKYLLDKSYSNKAWNKITGLSVSQINLIEISFLQLIRYHLYVSQYEFNQWRQLTSTVL
ncbi:hypothetical protein BB559_004354 [Furculomyces boomerangus]|uniref:Cyclin N-terminal domain-containing protein n=2 Tax=Harpellales TaxID=61421 RepID=A0A2T9YF77_9FUNG|nr:hypothetical protein BB559_004354 [Furculomyces boomerangus]PVZ99883.1 hypothetical protein BB558_004079 [Smittium angustum]